jgi:hypothetical protein
MSPLDDSSWLHQPPTLLHRTPVELAPKDEPKPSAEEVSDWFDIMSHLEGRLRALRTWRWAVWRHWRIIAEFIAPDRYKFFVTPNQTYRDGVVSQSIKDGTATLALEKCGAGLWTGIFDPAKKWFSLGTRLESVEIDRDAKMWLQTTTALVEVVLAQSNFYDVMAQACDDVSAFGTIPVTIYEDDKNVIACHLDIPGEFFLQIGASYEVDTKYKEFSYSVAQIVERFGLENCPHAVRQAWKNGGGQLDFEYIVAHAIEPNFPIRSRTVDNVQIYPVPEVFAYREVYWVRGQTADGELARAGFYERPFLTLRWSKRSNDAYAPTCPGMKALGDVQQLQLETLRKAEFLEKGIRPPMGADVSLKNEPSSIMPNRVTYMDTAGGTIKKYFPLFEVAAQWLAGITADIKEVQERIKEYFYVPIFMAISDREGVQPLNDQELAMRDLERLQPLGPPISLLTNEGAAPAIMRVLAIMERKGLVPPMPDSLRRVPLKIQFNGIMQVAQQRAAAAGIGTFMQQMGSASEAAIAAQLPNPLRAVNLDALAQELADVNGIKPTLVLSPDQVAKNDAAKHAATQQAQMPQQALAAAQGAQTLSQTPTGPGTLLHSLTQGRLAQGQPR